MDVIELGPAVARIRSDCEGRVPPASPFFFIVGAGLSTPGIPTASAIEADMRAKAAALLGQPPEPPADADAMTRYSHWFQVAIDSRERRRQYLAELMAAQPITAAAYRLAHLLSAGVLANVVVTPNFDDFLARALRLLGTPHVVLDHAAEAERLDPESETVQIMHVHGTYAFYDCANLGHELKARRRARAGDPASLAGRLDALLHTRVPIVLGYSGWEGDVIMAALRRRLGSARGRSAQRPLKHSLYWFCYDRGDLEGLPEFLRTHPDVRAVVARGLQRTLGDAEAGNRIAALIGRQVETPAGAAVGGAVGQLEETALPSFRQDDPTLPADTVLQRLTSAFEPDPPALVSNPLRFFADQLSASFPADHTSSAGDVFWFGRVVRRVRAAHESPLAAFDRQVDALVDAQIRGRHADVLDGALDMNWADATAAQQQEFAEIVIAAARALDDQTERERDGHALAARVLQRVAERVTLDDEGFELCRALHNRALVSEAIGDGADAIAARTELLDRFADATLTKVQALVVQAFGMHAIALHDEGDTAAAIALLEDQYRRFAAVEDETVQEWLAKSLALRGHLETLRGALDAGQRSFDTLLDRYGAASPAAARASVAGALTGRANAHLQAQRFVEAEADYRKVIGDFGDDATTTVQEQVALAYAGLVITLGMRGDVAGAEAAAAEAEGRLGGAADDIVRARVVAIRTKVLFALLQSGRTGEVIALAESVEAEDRPVLTPADRERLWTARLVHALALFAEHRPAEADRVLRTLAGGPEMEGDPMLRILHVSALSLQGMAAVQTGDIEEGLTILRRAADEFDDADVGAVLQQAATARFQLARLLIQLGRMAEAEAELRRLAGDARIRNLDTTRGLAAAAALELGAIAARAGDAEAAWTAFDDVVESFGEFGDQNSRLNVANALWNQATMALERRDVDGRSVAWAKLEEVVRRTADIAAPAFLERWAVATLQLAALEIDGGASETASARLDALDERLHSAGAPQHAALLMLSRHQRVRALHLQGWTEEALEVLRTLVPELLQSRDPRTFEAQRGVLFQEIGLLAGLERFDDALAAIDRSFAFADDVSEPADSLLRALLFGARVAIAGAIGRVDVQRTAARTLLDRWGGSSDPRLQAAFADAAAALGGAGSAGADAPAGT